MYIVSNDFHEYLQHKLTKWLMKQAKLVLTTYAGKSDNVITVDKERGIIYDLVYFSEPYLAKYYSQDKFVTNAEKLVIPIAKVVKLTADEMRKTDFTISVKVKLQQQEITKTLRYETYVMYISL
jgi:hypothetical protein